MIYTNIVIRENRENEKIEFSPMKWAQRVLGWAQKKFLTSQSQVNMLITQIHSLIFAIQMLAF